VHHPSARSRFVVAAHANGASAVDTMSEVPIGAACLRAAPDRNARYAPALIAVSSFAYSPSKGVEARPQHVRRDAALGCPAGQPDRNDGLPPLIDRCCFARNGSCVTGNSPRAGGDEARVGYAH
jgi:hypothetical protein